MYRGLTTNQQVADHRYGRSTTSLAASVASNNATSNGEYGGWFGHSGSVPHPTFSRAKSETIWRTGNGSSTAANSASIQDIMQLLKQGQSVRPAMANVTRSGPNGLRLVATRTNPSSVQQAPPAGLNGTTDPAAAANHAPQGNHAGERHQHNGELHSATNHLQPGDASQRRWHPGAAELANGDLTSLSKANGVLQQQQPPQQQRGFNNHSPTVHQRLAGSTLPNDQIRLLKSATTLGFAPERTEGTDEQQNNRNFRTPGGHYNINGNRNIYNAGPVPIWRNRWSQGRQQYRIGGQSAARPGPVTANEGIYRPDPSAHLNVPDGGSNTQGTGQLMTDNGRSASWQTNGTADEVASAAVLANRLREDRNHFHPPPVNSKLETVTPVDFMQAPGKQQRPGLYANLGPEENASKFGRRGLSSAFDRNNSSTHSPKLVPDGFRSEGLGTVPSNGSLYSQLNHDNKEISDESFVRSPGYGSVSTPRLGTNCAAAQGPGFKNASPRRSILKKPKVHCTDYESGINAKRRMDLYPMRHSAGSVACFNGLSHAGTGVDGFQNRRPDPNQKRVTFKLDK